MARDSLDESSPLIGRFDQSFLIHMIRDFFVLLVLVTVLEFALKAGMVYYSFRTEGPGTTRDAATDIADNVRSIMRNEGGPVAARTVSTRYSKPTGTIWATASPSPPHRSRCAR